MSNLYDNDLKEAIELREIGKFLESETLLQKYIQKNRPNIDAYAHLVQTLLLQEKIDQAWYVLKEAEKLDPQHLLLLTNRARLLLKNREIDKALNSISIAFSKDKNSADIQVVVANILRAKGDFAKAKQFIQSAISIDPKLAEAYLLRALLLNQEKAFKKALIDIQKALSLKPHLLTKLLSLIAMIKKSLHDNKGAIEALELLQKHTPKERHFSLLVDIAELNYANRETQKAIELLKKALNLNPNSSTVCKRIAFLLAREKATGQEAINYYHQAISIDPKDFGAYNSIAIIQMNTKQEKLAIENYKKALSINPNANEVYNNLGVLLTKQRNFQEAKRCFNKSLSIASDFPKTYHQLGDMFLETREFEKAQNSFEQLLKLEPNAMETHYKLGLVSMHRGELALSIGHYHTALEHRVKEIRKQKVFDVVLQEKIDTQKARDALKRLNRVFEKEKIPFILVFGTLLGIMRDDDILPHDKDIDIAIAWDIPREQIIDILLAHNFEIVNNSYIDKEQQWVISIVDNETNITIDIFFIKETEDNYLMGFYGVPEPLMWEFSKFKPIKHNWSGYQWLIPDNSERFFQEIYGRDWKTPNTVFDSVVSGKNLSQKSQKLSISYGLNRLIGVMDKNNYKKAIGYCQQLIAVQHNPPIIYEVLSLMQEMQKRLEQSNAS